MLIAQALYRSGDIEAYGSGIPRVRDACAEVGVRIGYERVPVGTKFVFHRNDAFASEDGREGAENVGVTPDHSRKMPEENETITPVSSHDETINETITLSEDERLLVRTVTANPHATYEDIAHLTGFSRAKTGRLIQGLRDAGVIERVGARKNGAWGVARNNER